MEEKVMTVRRMSDLQGVLEKVSGFRAFMEEFIEYPEKIKKSKGPILKRIGKQARKEKWKLTEGAYATAVCLEDILRLAVEEIGKRKRSPFEKARELLNAQAEVLSALYRLERAVTPLARNPMSGSAMCNRAIEYIQNTNRHSSLAELELALIYMLQSFLEMLRDPGEEGLYPERGRKRR